MEIIPTSSAMTDKELREIEFYANLGVISEDFVFRLLAEVRRLQDEIASVSGIDMIVAAPDNAHETAAGNAVTPGATGTV
jgi:hypothetical protein